MVPFHFLSWYQIISLLKTDPVQPGLLARHLNVAHRQPPRLLSLSGGIDSSATATIVHSMTRLVVAACQSSPTKAADPIVLADVRRLAQCGDDYVPVGAGLAQLSLVLRRAADAL